MQERDGEMTSVYRHRLRVPEEAVDTHGHANNVHYVQWMQDAAILHSANAGCTALTESLGATWVIRTHRIEYFRPAFANDQINVLTWVSDFRKVRSLRKYKFIRVSDGAVLARGETDWVFVDARSARPRVIPSEVKGTFTVVPEGEEP
jgi:acyl-CoA thioester hydrolase